MDLNIITPDETVFCGEASLVQMPGLDGLFEVLPHHAPMIAALGKGRVKAEICGKMEYFEIEGGIVEILDDKVLILAE